MYDNYNYPPGADTPDAPWNQPSYDPVDIDIETSITLSKQMTINTDDYSIDEDDKYIAEGNLRTEYNDQFYGIPDVLEAFVELVDYKLKNDSTLSKKDIQYLKDLQEEAKDWELTDVFVEQED